MSALQNAMAALIGVFHQHAGDDQLLNKAELKGLLDKEFKGMLGVSESPTEKVIDGAHHTTAHKAHSNIALGRTCARGQAHHQTPPQGSSVPYSGHLTYGGGG